MKNRKKKILDGMNLADGVPIRGGRGVPEFSGGNSHIKNFDFKPLFSGS